jgi:hypothetical protein
VALDATVTDDGLPSNTLTYTWSVSSGPAGATFADANAEDTTVTFASVGTYVLELTVSDSALDSSDMVQVFAAGKYETGEDAGWAEGDWDADGVFNSSDMVTAFADGGYEKGPRVGAVAVPEPTSVLLLVMGLIAVTTRSPRRRS